MGKQSAAGRRIYARAHPPYIRGVAGARRLSLLESPPLMTSPPSKPGGSLSVLGAVCLAALILPLSFSGGAVATPAIGRDLGGDPVGLTWITNAFMLSFGSLLMAAGALADQFGRKRVFTLGVGLFVACSFALSFAPSVGMVDLLRAVQGIGAAGALSGGTAALAQEFDGHARLRAFSMLGTTFGVGLAFGPLTAGVLIDSLGWRSIFMTSTIIGALALVFGVPRMRETRDPGATGLDWPGLVTFTGTLTLFTFGVIQAPASGWTSPLVLGLLAGAAVLSVLFIVVETRATRPMLDLSLFRYPRFIGVQFLPVATCYCYVVLLILLPLRFIGIEGASEIDAGLLMLALSAPMLVVPAVAASLTRWLSAGLISGIGLVVAAGGVLWLGSLADQPGLRARHAADRRRRRPALGPDGRPVGQRGAQGTGWHGHRHLQHLARGR
jgi:MFS family permease